MSPSPFVMECVGEWLTSRGLGIGRRSALDVAMGRGRHALALARAGVRVFGVDRNVDALREAIDHARRDHLDLSVWCADLAAYPLPLNRFDAVIVTRYLQRDLFRVIRDAIVPGGIVIYETFITAQLALGVGPKSPDHLLKPGELRQAFADFDILRYEEVIAPEAVARLAGRKGE